MHDMLPYNVNQMIPLSERVMRVFLEPATDHAITYQAGQYIELGLTTDNHRPFSIANAPLGARLLEFHIRHASDDPFADALLQQCRHGGELYLSQGKGDCLLPSSAQALCLIAGGVGFAPIKAIIEEVLANGITMPMHLFWGANNESDLYLDEIPLHWQQHVSHFHYSPVLTAPMHPESWQGATGSVLDCIAAYPQQELAQCHFIIQGPFPMAFACREFFLTHGIAEERLLSDAYSLTEAAPTRAR